MELDYQWLRKLSIRFSRLHCKLFSDHGEAPGQDELAHWIVEAFTAVLLKACDLCEGWIHGNVIMSNHFHRIPADPLNPLHPLQKTTENT